MDVKLTNAIQEWLDTPVSERDITLGAEMMLKLNRNRVLYQNVIRRGTKLMPKLEYEFKKYLKLRLDNKSVTDVVLLEKDVMPRIQLLVEAQEENANQATYAGKRSDHDELPESIQALWDDNFDVYVKIRALFEELKTMAKMPPCDRYELLKLLDEADTQYRSNLAKYDTYVVGNPITDADGDTGSENAVELATKINSSRKYLSSNKEKLAALIASKDAKADVLRTKMQERVDIILSAGVAITTDQQTEFESLGLVFK